MVFLKGIVSKCGASPALEMSADMMTIGCIEKASDELEASGSSEADDNEERAEKGDPASRRGASSVSEMRFEVRSHKCES